MLTTRRQLFKNLFLTAGALTVGKEAQADGLPEKRYKTEKYPFPNYLQMSALVKIAGTAKPSYYPDGSIEITVEGVGVSNVGCSGFKTVIYFLALSGLKEAERIIRDFKPDSYWWVKACYYAPDQCGDYFILYDPVYKKASKFFSPKEIEAAFVSVETEIPF
ncbi:MAG: hypothetical protein WCQ99_07505 [Pseudomonadota bacterium]